MTHRFLLNYPQNERISTQLLDFFWSELVYARSMTDHELWIVSPWITESHFDLSVRGSYEDLWPGFTKSSIPLSFILKKFIDYQSTINIVCRPPHILVPAENLLAFHDTKTKFAQMEHLFEELNQLLGEIKYLTSNQRKLKVDIESVTMDLRRISGELRVFLDILRRASKGQSDTIAFIQDIKSYGHDRVNIYYNYRLHAKILLGKLGGFIGSANVTHSGFNFNDELLFYMTDKETLKVLRIIASRLAQFEGDWWKKKSSEYSLSYEYRRQVGDEALLKAIARSKELPDDIKEVLGLLGIST